MKNLHQVWGDTGYSLEYITRMMDDRDGWRVRESGKPVLSVRLDDDDDADNTKKSSLTFICFGWLQEVMLYCDLYSMSWMSVDVWNSGKCYKISVWDVLFQRYISYKCKYSEKSGHVFCLFVVFCILYFFFFLYLFKSSARRRIRRRIDFNRKTVLSPKLINTDSSPI